MVSKCLFHFEITAKSNTHNRNLRNSLQNIAIRVGDISEGNLSSYNVHYTLYGYIYGETVDIRRFRDIVPLQLQIIFMCFTHKMKNRNIVHILYPQGVLAHTC